MLKGLLATNQGLEVTPQILLQFIAEKTKHSPHDSPHASSNEDDTELLSHAQGNESDPDANHSSHSSSSDSIGSAGYARYPSRPPSRGLATPSSTNAPSPFDASAGYARYPSRPPSRGATTPSSAKAPSPFDASRRKRSTPLGQNAPSSWTKPVPAHRRKSDAGSRSDSEVCILHCHLKCHNNHTISRSRSPLAQALSTAYRLVPARRQTQRLRPFHQHHYTQAHFPP
jgi:hypothetical protein